MESNITGLILGILLIGLLMLLALLIGVYISLMMKRPCPHCRRMMYKGAVTCPRCGKSTLQAA